MEQSHRQDFLNKRLLFVFLSHFLQLWQASDRLNLWQAITDVITCAKIFITKLYMSFFEYLSAIPSLFKASLQTDLKQLLVNTNKAQTSTRKVFLMSLSPN